MNYEELTMEDCMEMSDEEVAKISYDQLKRIVQQWRAANRNKATAVTID